MSVVRSGFASTPDGADLYWRTTAPSALDALDARPTLVCCNGVGVSTFFFHYLVEHFRDRHRVLVWDYQGHGRSALPHEPVAEADLSIERNAADLGAVLDAAGVRGPIVLLGHSMGCQVIFEYAHQHPDRVAGLVALFGAAGKPLDTFLDLPNMRQAFDVLNRVQQQSGTLGARLLRPLYESPFAFDVGVATGMIDRHYAKRTDIARYLEHLSHMDSRVFFRMVELMADHDSRPWLGEIQAPALVFAGENDLFTPMRLSRDMVELLPHAELMVLADASHAAIVEQPETINRRVERFLTERVLRSAGGGLVEAQ